MASPSTICPNCGNANLSQAVFCPSCGAFISSQQSKRAKWAIGILAGSLVAVGALSVVVTFTFFHYPVQQQNPDRLILITPTEQKKPIVTLAQYERLQPGMTYQQAVSVLDGDGVLLSRNENGGIVTVRYEWKGKKNRREPQRNIQRGKTDSKSTVWAGIKMCGIFV